jgi:hypothetical protein
MAPRVSGEIYSLEWSEEMYASIVAFAGPTFCSEPCLSHAA